MLIRIPLEKDSSATSPGCQPLHSSQTMNKPLEPSSLLSFHPLLENLHLKNQQVVL